MKLIGLTHAPGQVDFLRTVVTSASEPSQRPVAIEALGMVCDDEARGLLAKMLKDSTLGVGSSDGSRTRFS